MRVVDDSSGAGPRTHAAFTVSQIARLGARDGLSLWVHNVLIFHNDSQAGQNGFIYGGTSARLMIPLSRASDIFLEGGGGVMGYWFGGAGVSTWLVGSGSAGSWRLSVSAGAAGISGTSERTYQSNPMDPSQTSTYIEDVSIAGPMVSIGLTRRFAL